VLILAKNKLFNILINSGYLVARKGSDYNMPTQKSMNLGLFKITESMLAEPDGKAILNKTAKATGKGQEYFINAFLNSTSPS
jgi:anti-repressor protein